MNESKGTDNREAPEWARPRRVAFGVVALGGLSLGALALGGLAFGWKAIGAMAIGVSAAQGAIRVLLGAFVPLLRPGSSSRRSGPLLARHAGGRRDRRLEAAARGARSDAIARRRSIGRFEPSER